ncbi:MAG: TetR/AcrR family transcriptional regulator [Actinomycetota bacterium]|nr:TetR/AcrR family transcriptional regulator [Actinomycetota bacterium]
MADLAGVPLSQIHYHFGGKHGILLALLERENEQLLRRQRAMYVRDAPLWRRYAQACDFLEDDMASGYVRLLQEMIAAGWADAQMAERVSAVLAGWRATLAAVAADVEPALGGYGPFTAEEVEDLVFLAHLGAESLLMLGRDPAEQSRLMRALRRVGDAIRLAENAVVPTRGATA